MLRQSKIPLYVLASMAVGLSACKTQLSFEPDELAETGDAGPDDDIGDPDPDDDETETETETGDSFVPDMPDTGPSCDPFAQDCPEGEKCVPWASSGANWDSNKCVPVSGSGTAGDTCTYGGVVAATDDCDADTHCWDVQDVDGQLEGTCTAFCAGTPDSPQCQSDTACLIANEGSITLCIETCDPLLQACNEGLGCFWANDDFQCIFTSQNIALGQPCGFINDCTPGNTCLDAEVVPACAGSACCGSFCDLGDPTCGVEGTECSAFFEEGMAPPGYEDVGVCILPGA